MKTVKRSTEGQFVIPEATRKAHHLAAGTKFVVSFVGDEIRMIPLPMFPHTTVADTAGLLAKRGRKNMHAEKSSSTVSKTLRARDAATRS